MLPLEFLRESGNKRITLVIYPKTQRVASLWSVLDVPDMLAARKTLGLREYDRADQRWIEKNIGFWDSTDETAFGSEAAAIAEWARPRGFSGVVWTNLPPKFRGASGSVPSAAEVVAHLAALEGGDRAEAEKYVRLAPQQIDTPYRRQIAAELGWAHRA